MKEKIARNITRYRKEKSLTQKELAEKLNITFQAVSKWETGQTLPDIELLPKLSSILGLSIDKLMGYSSQDKSVTIYEDIYNDKQYYWGIEPSKMCLRILDIFPPIKHVKVLDIGCGEGKDAVFLARNGYDVSAFDISDAGLKKAEKLADRYSVNVNFFKADILDYRLDAHFDILFSSGVLQYISKEYREEILYNYKEFTGVGGVHIFNVLLTKPFLESPPEKEPNFTKWLSGELFTYYDDWQINECREFIFNCTSSGIAHKHAINTLIAKKRC